MLGTMPEECNLVFVYLLHAHLSVSVIFIHYNVDDTPRVDWRSPKIRI